MKKVDICITDRLIQVETIVWLIPCTVLVYHFKLPVALKEAITRAKLMHRFFYLSSLIIPIIIPIIITIIIIRQNLTNKVSYKFSSTAMNVISDISLTTQDRAIGLLLLLVYSSKLQIEGWLDGSYYNLVETQHFCTILMIVLLLISSNSGRLEARPNAADITLQLVSTISPYWSVNSILNIYSSLPMKGGDEISQFVNVLHMVIMMILPLYLLCRKHFLVIQIIRSNGHLLIFGAWLHAQLRWTVQQFLAIYWMTNIEAMLCPDKMMAIINHLPRIPSYRTHLYILILGLGFLSSKVYNHIANDMSKVFESTKVVTKSSIKER